MLIKDIKCIMDYADDKFNNADLFAKYISFKLYADAMEALLCSVCESTQDADHIDMADIGSIYVVYCKHVKTKTTSHVVFLYNMARQAVKSGTGWVHYLPSMRDTVYQLYSEVTTYIIEYGTQALSNMSLKDLCDTLQPDETRVVRCNEQDPLVLDLQYEYGKVTFNSIARHQYSTSCYTWLTTLETSTNIYGVQLYAALNSSLRKIIVTRIL